MLTICKQTSTNNTAANIRIGYMAGLMSTHWADVVLFGSGSGGRKSIGQCIFT
jgi:hypothetical protein